MGIRRGYRANAAVEPGRVPIRGVAQFGVALLFAATIASGAESMSAPTHRSLRDNAQIDLTTPTEPLSFSGYADASAFKVVPQKPGLTLFPCTNCHAALPPNPTPRLLASPHVASLPHGNGRFWCVDCHDLKERDHLRGLKGQAIDFDDSYLVCGQCHFRQQKDWYYGAHGKRVANWRGEREIYSCTHCHDPHDPVLKPRAPSAPPKIRAGLTAMPTHAVAAKEAAR